MKEKQESTKDTEFFKQFPTPPRQNRCSPLMNNSLETSPLAGLPSSRVEAEKENIVSAKLANRESVMWMLFLGAHLGRFPIKSANFPPSPLMEGQLSGKRGEFSLINQQNISVQLLRAFYIIALLLKKGGRVLLINQGDEKNMSRHIFPSYTRGATKGLHQEEQLVPGERLIYSQGVWKAGTCSNWSEICKKVWNWSHCEQFLAHSPEGKQGKQVLAKKPQSFLSCWARKTSVASYKEQAMLASQEQQKITSLMSLLRNKSNNPRSSRKTPLLYYTKKPDVILVLTGKKSSSLIGEARTLKVPLLYMADTDFAEIQSTFASNESSGCTGNYGVALKSASRGKRAFLLGTKKLAGSKVGAVLATQQKQQIPQVLLRTKKQEQSLFTNAAYPCIVNSDSFPLSFFLSSLLAELTRSGKKRTGDAG